MSLRILSLLASIWLVFAGVAPAEAARTFPQNSRQVKITAVENDAIMADGTALHLAPGVLISNPDGSTIVTSALRPGVIARVQLDLNGDVRHVWILGPDEILVRPWWQFWMRSQPQSQPAPALPGQ